MLSTQGCHCSGLKDLNDPGRPFQPGDRWTSCCEFMLRFGPLPRNFESTKFLESCYHLYQCVSSQTSSQEKPVAEPGKGWGCRGRENRANILFYIFHIVSACESFFFLH